MPMQTTCPGCRRPLRMKEELAGTLVRCPACATEFVAQPDDVPEMGIRPAEGPPRPPAPPAGEHIREGEPSPRLPRYDDYEDDDDLARPPSRRRGPDMDAAREKVNGPAIGLLVVGVLGLAAAAFAVAANVLGLAVGNDPNAGINAAVNLGSMPLSIATCIIILIGAHKMRRLENIGLAKAAAIIAMIPCTSPCCLLGLPFGIWALTVLNDNNVADAFRARYRGFDNDFERDRDRD